MKRDLHDYARKTNFGLIIGSIIILGIVGIGLIDLIYGQEAALMGLLCLLGALLPIALIALLLYIIDRIVKHANPQ